MSDTVVEPVEVTEPAVAAVVDGGSTNSEAAVAAAQAPVDSSAAAPVLETVVEEAQASDTMPSARPFIDAVVPAHMRRRLVVSAFDSNYPKVPLSELEVL